MSTHNLRPTSRFTGCAGAYAKHRPSYPGAAIDCTLRGAPSAVGLRVVDVGAGTGISARLYVARGCAVVAIEPNAEMREAGIVESAQLKAEMMRGEQAREIRCVDGAAEATGLPDAIADLVVCAQAFHWFDPPRAFREFGRVLDPRSPLRRVALLWNELDDSDAATAGYRDHMRRHAVESPQSPWNTPPGEPVMSAAATDAGFVGGRIERFPNHQDFDEEGLVGRAKSASYMPRDAERWAAAERDLRSLFREFARNDVFTLRYQTEVHVAEQRRAQIVDSERRDSPQRRRGHREGDEN